MQGLRSRARLLAAAAVLLNCTLIALIAYTLADLGWRAFAPAAATAELAAAPDGTDAAPAADAAVDFAAMVDWHLFGETAAAAPAVAPAAAPETRLDLRLAGIFYNAVDQQRAMALIAQDGGVEKRYRAGDRLDGGVSIEQILADKVLLSRAGRPETLTLPRERGARAAPRGQNVRAPAARLAAPGAGVGSAVQVNAGAVAERLRRDARPDSLRDLAYATPHIEDGRFVGLRLKPGRKKRMLSQLGLRAGDVLTELNGTRLTDPAQGAVLLQELLSADRISAKVVRNGAEMPFTFVLNQ